MAILAVTVYPGQIVPGLYSVFRIIPSYIHRYYVLRYISQQHPTHYPQNHGNNWVPKDNPRTILLNEGILFLILYYFFL
jgi:hypothetical protein